MVTATHEQLTDPPGPGSGPGESDLVDLLAALRAVRRGDFRTRLPTDRPGLIGEIADAFNEVVELNQRTSLELRRISRAVGRDGRVRQRASIGSARGEWADNIHSVNELLSDVSEQTIEIGRVVGAVARGDLSERMALDLEGRPLRGEFRRTAQIVNTMVDQLNAFASEVTRVAREVGTEGKLGGQADVPGTTGTWRGLTDNVNLLAANLTTQVRAMAEVATAVTRGDLTREIAVEAEGEVELLKDHVNEMIRNLRDTTRKNAEQDWLKTNITRFGRLLQGQRDLEAVGRLILSEIAPLIGVQRGVLYVVSGTADERLLTPLAGYATEPALDPRREFRFGEGLVGQCALERRRIVLTDLPPDYVPISSGLGQSPPRSLAILPILFEDETRAVVELASLDTFEPTHLAFLDQLTETIGIVINTIAANTRAEELVQEQAARAEAEEGLARLRQVVAVMPEGILIADAAGRIYLSNAAAEEIMGRVPASVTGGDVPDVFHLDGTPCPPDSQPLAAAVVRRQAVRGEQLLVRNAATGNDVAILVNSVPLSDAQGIPAGGVAVFQDISPIRDLDRQKDEFLAAVSHDLKTPATIIKGRANLLQRALRRGDGSVLSPSSNGDGAATLQFQEGLQAIDESTAQLVRLVDELLDLTRLRMGQQIELDLGPTDLVRLCRRMAIEYQNISPRHTIAVQSGPDRLLGDWDEARLERVVGNLISNAVKYSPRGGEIVVALSREERDSGEWAILAVTDHGLGIPADEMIRVFEPYYRGTNVSRISGTGVGLAGTRHIVEQHGGSIEVDSVRGHSTTFRVSLPLVLEPAEIVDQ